MMKLIRLEWKKNNVLKYIRNAVITTVVLAIMIVPMAGELEASGTVQLYGNSMLCTTTELFVHMAYIIFTGVMLAAFLVGAYEKKTMNLMFSYPIKRKKILLSKMAAVWIFNLIAMIVSKVLIYLVLIWTRSFTGISASEIQFGRLSFWLEILLGSAAMVSISYISLLIGLKMRSSKATIVSSVVIVCLTQGNIGSATLANNLPFFVILFAAAIVSVYLSIYNVETKDLL